MERGAHYWIETLALVPHPEGGYYRETYRCEDPVRPPGRETLWRSCATAIYYLLPSDEVSRLHRLRSDELFHFYEGAPLTIHVLTPEGRRGDIRLGREPGNGEKLQAVVPAGCWFGATVEQPGAFALVGCTVAPGFDFADFEQADRATLVQACPEHRELIERLTPEP